MHRVVTLVGPRISMFEMAVPCEVFGIRRAEIPTWDYDHVVCTAEAGGSLGQGGLRITAPVGIEALDEADTVVVPPWTMSGNEDLEAAIRPVPEVVLDALRAAHHRGARIVSMCTGAFVLARAGLLDGRSCTTHWMLADRLARCYPDARVDPSVLYVGDGGVWTAAGTAAGIDLCLHLVRLDLGAEAANMVARRLVVPPHRDGGQAQFIDAPIPACAGDDPLAGLLRWLVEHLDEPIGIDELARRAGMSPRTLARRFGEATGTTPLQWVVGQRVLLARRLLETTDLAVEEVARRCGFGTAAALRVHFQRSVDSTPAAYRRAFRGAVAS